MTELTLRLALAGLIGLAVGIEREWSSPVDRAERRFAGLRTFFLIGLLGGIAGGLFASGYPAPATALLAAGGAFIVGAFVMAIRRPEQRLDGTTEMAALVVLGLAFLAGLGHLTLAAGAVAVVILALGEKSRLHGWVRHIDQVEMQAGIQFLVLALVVLPLLPPGPYESLWGFQPRSLWVIVLALSGINFAGYIARKAIGATRGYGVTGIIGGVVSSTATTLQLSRLSRSEPMQGRALALGVIGACTVLPIRVTLLTFALNPDVARAVVPYLLPSFLVGLLLLVVGLRSAAGEGSTPPEARNPLRLGAALQMAVLFQASMMVLSYTRTFWGTRGIDATATILGLTDVDALTVSMSRLTDGVDLPRLAARGITLGIASNTVVKIAVAGVVGSSPFRRWAVAGLALLLGMLALTLWVGSPA